MAQMAQNQQFQQLSNELLLMDAERRSTHSTSGSASTPRVETPRTGKKTAPTPAKALYGTPRDLIEGPSPCLYELEPALKEAYKKEPKKTFSKSPRIIHDLRYQSPGPSFYTTAGTLSARSVSSAKEGTFGTSQRLFGSQKSLETMGPGPSVFVPNDGLGKDGAKSFFGTTPRILHVPSETPSPNMYMIERSPNDKLSVSRNKDFGSAGRSTITSKEGAVFPGPGQYEARKRKKKRSQSESTLHRGFGGALRMVSGSAVPSIYGNVSSESPGPGAYDHRSTVIPVHDKKNAKKPTGFGTSERSCMSEKVVYDSRDYKAARSTVFQRGYNKAGIRGKLRRPEPSAAEKGSMNTGFGKSPRILGEPFAKNREGPGPGDFSPPWSAPARFRPGREAQLAKTDSPSYSMGGKPP